MTNDMLFRSKAPWIIQGLMREFGLSKIQAAAILGNIGHECAGFHQMQEGAPIGGGRGGYGWCQWTASRRTRFEHFAAAQHLSPDSDKANYGYLLDELHSTHKRAITKLRATNDLESAVKAFEIWFEGADPRYKFYDRRNRWARIALEAYEHHSPELAEAVLGDGGSAGSESLDSPSGAAGGIWAAGAMEAETASAGPDASAEAMVAPPMAALPAAAASAFAIRARDIATAEWEFFGKQTNDKDGQRTHNGHKEGESRRPGEPGEDWFKRVGTYWIEGTHTHGLDGHNHDWPWSATFISWVMRKAGADERFRYSKQHSTFIAQGIRDFLNHREAAGYWTERLSEAQPEVGDIVCWGRQAGVDYDHQMHGDYHGHSDVVVAVEPRLAWVIGGNVGNSVTRRPLVRNGQGFLVPVTIGGENLFGIMKCRI
jgi:hypothetical protein